MEQTTEPVVQQQTLPTEEKPTIDEKKEIVFVLIRHGETDWNAAQRIQGRGINVDLNKLGQKQAQQVSKRVKEHIAEYGDFDFVACSSLKRAIQTAQIICEGVGITQPLIEYDGLQEVQQHLAYHRWIMVIMKENILINLTQKACGIWCRLQTGNGEMVNLIMRTREAKVL
jgi:bisphosphoglycerate-dependent phosphoglycerate mutase